MNLSSLVATITKKDGTFRIVGKLGDSIAISSVQYEVFKLVLDEKIINSQKLEVRLITKVNELDEVTVKPHNLTGNLATDIANTRTVNETIRPSKLGLPNAYVKPRTQTERRIYEAKSGGGILPLNPIINAITGRTKKLKNQLKLEQNEKKLTQTKEQFDDELYSNFLKIPSDRLDDFMYFCAVDEAFTAIQLIGDNIKMLEFLRKKSDQYRELNNIKITKE